MTVWDPTDLEVQLALGFENLCECLRDTVRGHGLNKSKWAEKIYRNVEKWSEKWENLHRCVLDTDDIPGLLSIKDPKVYRTRQTCRMKDQKREKNITDKEYYHVLLEAARMQGGTEIDASKFVNDFPRNLFYSEKPWVTTTIEHPPRRAGNDLVFFKFFMNYLGEGRVPEHVWLQAKLHLFLIEDHMRQEQGDYCKLDPTLIAICLTPTGHQRKVIRIEEEDDLRILIRDSADYHIGAMLPRLHECGCTKDRHIGVHDAQSISDSFIPEQDQSQIEVGTTVYNVKKKKIGVVREIVKAHKGAKVAWEGCEHKKLRLCELESLIATPVRIRIEPKCVGERVVIMGATDLAYVGRQGTIKAYSHDFCQVLLDGSKGEIRRFSRRLLHSTQPSECDVYGPREILEMPYGDNHLEDLEVVNEYLLQQGHGFQLIHKYCTKFDSPLHEVTDEKLEREGSSSEEDEAWMVEEYCRIAKGNSRSCKGYSDDRLRELRTNFSLWLSDWDINAYIGHINTRLANSYTLMNSNDLGDPLQYVWVCQNYVYESIYNCEGDLTRMRNLWNRIPHFADFLLLPVGLSYHWSLILIGFPLSPQETFVLHLDSMPKENRHDDRIDIEKIRMFLSAGKYFDCGENLQYEDLDAELCESPRQPNGYDCGPYTLACIKCFVDAIECKTPLSGKGDVVSLINRWEFSAQTAEGMRTQVYQILSAVNSSQPIDTFN